MNKRSVLLVSLLILLVDLMGVTPDPYARAVAIQGMRAWVMPPPRAAISRPLDVRALSHILNQSGLAVFFWSCQRE